MKKCGWRETVLPALSGALPLEQYRWRHYSWRRHSGRLGRRPAGMFLGAFKITMMAADVAAFETGILAY